MEVEEGWKPRIRGGRSLLEILGEVDRKAICVILYSSAAFVEWNKLDLLSFLR